MRIHLVWGRLTVPVPVYLFRAPKVLTVPMVLGG